MWQYTDVVKYYIYDVFGMRECVIWSIHINTTITLFSFSRIVSVSHSIVYIALLCCTDVTICYKVNKAFFFKSEIIQMYKFTNIHWYSHKI